MKGISLLKKITAANIYIFENYINEAGYLNVLEMCPKNVKLHCKLVGKDNNTAILDKLV